LRKQGEQLNAGNWRRTKWRLGNKRMLVVGRLKKQKVLGNKRMLVVGQLKKQKVLGNKRKR
jgi:hypothetical protein